MKFLHLLVVIPLLFVGCTAATVAYYQPDPQYHLKQMFCKGKSSGLALSCEQALAMWAKDEFYSGGGGGNGGSGGE